ncbi:MAG: flagellar hook protein, partial [Butyrivibrio sp.]|nr:flagellar hook protein [Butyrivibrio sp.]
MPIRITGMNSGLDTESIITALTQTKTDKLNTLKGDQKKLTWKQDKWKELNTKVASFYNGTLSAMRFSTAYSKKTTTVSKESAVSIVTGDSAMNTTQTLSVGSLAKAAYLTGNEVKDSAGNTAKGSTKVEDLGLAEGDTLKFSIGDDPNDVLSVEIKAGD